MKTVKLTNGFEVKVEPDELNDMYFVEALAEIETDVLALPKVMKMMLGDEQKKALTNANTKIDEYEILDSSKEASYVRPKYD